MRLAGEEAQPAVEVGCWEQEGRRRAAATVDINLPRRSTQAIEPSPAVCSGRYMMCTQRLGVQNDAHPHCDRRQANGRHPESHGDQDQARGG